MANFNFNLVVLGGRLVADPELKTTQGGTSVCSVSVATKSSRKNASGEYDTDFFGVTAWGKTAEMLAQYFRKGSSIAVKGELVQEKWTDKEGHKRDRVTINAQSISFVDSRNEQPTASGGVPTASVPSQPAYVPDQYKTPSSFTPQQSFDEVTSEEELPF